MIASVRLKTIEPLIKATVLPDSMIYTDEYAIYGWIEQWGYGHKSVYHGAGEDARDEDGDGFVKSM